MAVTIHTSPVAFSPSDNPLTFRFSSNQTAQANFSYVVQTYYESVLVSEDRVFPESGIYAHWDVSPIIKNLLSTPTRTTALYANSGTTGRFYIVVTENYGTPPTNQASATSATIRTFKACLSDKDWSAWNPATWQNLLFLTNYPRGERIYQQRVFDFYLGMITDASKTLELKFYDSAGALQHTYTDTQTRVLTQLNLSTGNLTATAGVPDIDIISYYTVQIGTSEMLTIYFYDDYCNGIQSLQWINEFGVWDQFVFAHNIERKGSVTERMYGRKFGGWAGVSFDYDLQDAGNVRVGTQQTDKATIYTEWISESVQNWLIELYKAPRFTLYKDELIPCRVTSTEFTYKQQRFEDLISESVDVEYVNNHNGLSL